MNNPQLWLAASYITSNKITTKIVDKFFPLIKWNPEGGDWIMDIGCGTGDTTSDIFFPKFPNTIEKVTAIDVSEKMIEFASKNCKNPKIEFDVMDFRKDVLEKYIGKFDHVVSSFCLHWIQDQRKCFENIYSLLKPGGDTLFWFVGDQPQITLSYIEMANEEKWAPYYKDLKESRAGLPPYRDEIHPEKVLRKNLEAVGFRAVVCEKVSMAFNFDDDESFKGFVESINPFVNKEGNIDEGVKKEYMDDLFGRIKKMEMTKNKDCSNVYHIDTLVAFANK